MNQGLILVAFAMVMQQPAAKEFRSEVGGFRIKAVGEPKETTQKIEMADGIVEFKMHQWTGVKKENFGVSYHPVVRTEPPQPAKLLYESVASGSAENLKGRVEYRRSFEHQGIPASEVLIALPNNQSYEDAIYKVRLYWVGDRFFQVIYVGPRARLRSKEVIDFFDTFKVDEGLLK